MPSDCDGVSCFLQNFEKNFGYFHFSVSSSTFMAASWLSTFVSRALSTILSIDRSEPRFESHTGYNKNFAVFLLIFSSAKSDSKLFRPVQENERRDI